MKIEKGRAVALFVALGLKNADKWNDDRISTKLSKVNEMVDEDVKLEEDEAKTLAEVRVAIEAGESFEVEAGAEEVVEPAAKAAKKGKTDEEKAAEKATKDAEKAAAKEAKDAEKAAAKAAKEAEKAVKKAEREASAGKRSLPRKMKVGAAPGNHEFSGQVMAEFDLPDTITKEMCDRHCELRGKVNDDAVDYLTYAWKIISAYKNALAAKQVS